MMKKLILSALVALSLSTTVQSQITDFTFTDTDNNSHTLFEYLSAGKAVVLDPYFITCYYCQVFSPQLETLYKSYGSNSANVIFLGLEIESGTKAAVDAYRLQYGATYPHVYDPDSSSVIKSWWGVNFFPTYGGNFAQIYVLIPNTGNPGASIIEYSETGALNATTLVNVQNTLMGKGFLPTGLGDAGYVNDQISLFPNPASNMAKLKMASLTGNVSVELYNLLGKKVATPFEGSLSVSKRVIDINTSKLPNGYYFVKVKSGDQAYTLNLSIAH